MPFDPRAELVMARAPVRVPLCGHSYRSTIAPTAHEPRVPLRRSHREAAGLKGGETVEVTLELDTETRDVEAPPDLEAAFKAPPSWERWRALSFTHRREHVEAIEEARKPETRARRIERVVSAVLGARR